MDRASDLVSWIDAGDFFLDPYVFDFAPNGDRIYVVTPHPEDRDAVGAALAALASTRHSGWPAVRLRHSLGRASAAATC